MILITLALGLALGLAMVLAATVPGFVDTIWPVVAMLLPFIQARMVNAGAEKWFKFGVAVVFAIVAGGATALGMDWSAGFELSELVERIAAVFGVAYATYKAIDLRLESATQTGLNDQDLVAPDRGLGG